MNKLILFVLFIGLLIVSCNDNGNTGNGADFKVKGPYKYKNDSIPGDSAQNKYRSETNETK